ncbi:MAG: hypothetical protein QGD96_01655 [Anaerolineae bacterium]|nr:hypothetical protein [Anaerolineae bacterium]
MFKKYTLIAFMLALSFSACTPEVPSLEEQDSATKAPGTFSL